MTELSTAELPIHAEIAKLKDDPMFPAIYQLRTAACERELVLLREPDTGGTKQYAKWEKQMYAAGDYDFDAYHEFIETVPTTPHGAASAISVFLEHSLSCDAIECYPQVETFLKSLRAYLRNSR